MRFGHMVFMPTCFDKGQRGSSDMLGESWQTQCHSALLVLPKACSAPSVDKKKNQTRLCYPSALLSNCTDSWQHSQAHTHTGWHASFWQSSVIALISQHHRGIYFWNEGKEKVGVGSAGEYVTAKRLVKCIYFSVGGRKQWSWSGAGRLMTKMRFRRRKYVKKERI